jgi:hypothetical protein
MIRPECPRKEATELVLAVRSSGLSSVLLAIACSSQPAASASDIASANDTGRTVTATNDGERALLKEVANLPSGASRQVQGLTVRAGKTYAAASGRTCRALTVTSSGSKAPTERLVCSDGASWFFVPDVMGGTGSED